MNHETGPSAVPLLPSVTEPISAPTTLQNLVEEYNARAKLGELNQCAALLKDALGYFARYYAAVAVEASRELDCLAGEIALSWSGPPAVDVALGVLQCCLDRLRGRSERLARKLVGVFFHRDGEPRSFWPTCRPALDASTDFQVACFCTAAPDENVSAEQVGEAARVLDAWVAASFAFFLECEQRLETGAFFGQLEQVVLFEQFTLRTGLTMRVRESRGMTGLPPLAGALVDSLAAPIEALPEPVENAPVAAAEPVIVVKPVVVIPPQAEALHTFLQTQKETVPAPERVVEESQRAQVSRVQITLEPLGFRRGPQGKIGYGGHFYVSSLEGEDIRGDVSATGGQVDLRPSYFEGPRNRIVYWAHPDDVTLGKEYVRIQAEGEERLYALWKLAPPSRFENLSQPKQGLLLLFPGLLGVAYSSWIFYATHQSVARQLRETLADNYDRFLNPLAPLSLRRAGIGQLDVNIKPQIESANLIFLLTAWLVPLAVTKIYSRFPRRNQKALVLLYVLGCCWPSLYFLGLWSSHFTQSVITQHPEMAQLDYRRSFVLFALLNGFASMYLMVSVEGRLHRFLNELGRFALAGLLAALAGLLIVLQVYGYSWFM